MNFSQAHDPFLDLSDPCLKEAIDKSLAFERLNRQDAENLYYHASLPLLGMLAHNVRLHKHPELIVTYVGDRNINYSNICVCGCKFCAFFRPPGHPEGYVISREELAKKIEETLEVGGKQILMQGGLHPDLPFEWYEDLIKWIHTNWPQLHIHSFSPPEVMFWSKRFNIPVKEILSRLKSAGLHSLPGGGAEVLHNEARKKASPNKCNADEWLMVMEKAHEVGMRCTATMMFGHLEESSQRLDHLFAVRDLQDRTGVFTAFIPWTFQPNNTRIHVFTQPAPAYLRLLATSRLILDNVDNIQSSWVTMSPEIGQIALFYGANDFGSLMIEENVVKAAGTSFRMNREEIHSVISKAGFIPRQRLMDYSLL